MEAVEFWDKSLIRIGVRRGGGLAGKEDTFALIAMKCWVQIKQLLI